MVPPSVPSHATLHRSSKETLHYYSSVGRSERMAQKCLPSGGVLPLWVRERPVEISSERFEIRLNKVKF